MRHDSVRYKNAIILLHRIKKDYLFQKLNFVLSPFCGIVTIIDHMVHE